MNTQVRDFGYVLRFNSFDIRWIYDHWQMWGWESGLSTFWIGNLSIQFK